MFAYAKPEQKNKASVKNAGQRKNSNKNTASPNVTGISDNMKIPFNNLSGFSYEDMRTHNNSDKPAQLQPFTHKQSNGNTPIYGSVVQMLRKRVRGNSPEAVAEDIFYDKKDGKYYTGMTEAAEETKLLKDGEAESYNISKAKDRSPHTIIASEATDGSFIRSPIESPTGYRGKVLKTDNAEIAAPPIAVRLYAEGNFEHADALAQTMPEEKDFEKLLDLDGSTVRQKTSATPVIIKGTEYDTRGSVEQRYKNSVWINVETYNRGRYTGDEGYRSGYLDGRYHRRIKQPVYKYTYPKLTQRQRAYNEGYDIGYADEGACHYTDDFTEIRGKIANAQSKPNLELSFSGRTGDLTRDIPGKETPTRQYDLIQSTFFWLPGSRSTDVRDSLIEFLKNQYKKVKDSGMVRIVLANRNNPDKKVNDENQYRRTADEIIQQAKEKPLKYMYECQLIELKQGQAKTAYSTALVQKGLNPGERFKHTMTDAPMAVGTGGGDIIIQAKKLTAEEAALSKLYDFIENTFG